MSGAAVPASAPRSNAFLGRATRSGALVIGLVLVALVVLAALLAPWLSPHDPNAQNIVDKLVPPDRTYWLGTDSFGRDVFSRILWGARTSLLVGFVSTAIGVGIGVAVGIVSGYFGGAVDRWISGANDVLMSFPQIIMGIVIVAVLGPSLTNLVIAIAITAVPAFVRVARGSTLAMKERDFVDACRALGFGNPRIMFLHVLPNIMDEVVVMGSLWFAAAIRTESTLAFIGLGVPPPTATWGGVIRDGFDNLLDAPWLSIFPSLAILTIMVALNLIGDGLRDASDPRAPQ